jgi:hypothetical protein
MGLIGVSDDGRLRQEEPPERWETVVAVGARTCALRRRPQWAAPTLSRDGQTTSLATQEAQRGTGQGPAIASPRWLPNGCQSMICS